MESQAHVELVNIAAEYIKSIIPEEYHIFMCTDTMGSNDAIKVIGNYIPDVYYCYNNQLVIGEAKTLNDFDRLHSKEQFIAYMNEFLIFQGKTTLVVSVPWQLVLTAKNYFIRLRREMQVDANVVILNEIGRCFLI